MADIGDGRPGEYFKKILGKHYVDARIRKLTIHEDGLPPIAAHFLYPAFKRGKPSVTELVAMLMDEITGFCATKAQRREAKHRDAEDIYESKAIEELARWAKKLFIKAQAKESRSGEGGELLLYVLIEHFLKAPLVLSKMRLKTSIAMPVHGADGVHARWDEEGQNLTMFFGESKMHSTFAGAMKDAAKSIGEIAKNIDDRLNHELQLTTGHIDLDGFPDELREYLLRFLHPYITEEGNNRTDRFAILLGYDYHIYSKLTGIDNTKAEQEFLIHYKKSLRRSLETAQLHLNEQEIDLSSVDLFLFPMPDVQDFRDMFQEELNG